MNRSSSALTARDIVVVSATDDGYAMPLAVTIRSALNSLGRYRRMQLFILDGGLSDANKARLLQSWTDPRLTVHWIRPDMEQVRDLFIDGHVNVVTYLRLLMPMVLPERLSRVIYLDADMLVRRDLGDLWDEDQGGHAVLAVPDVAAPCLDAPTYLPTFDYCRRYLAAHRPIANFRELGLPGDAAYFNGGMLVVDLGQWRRQQYAERMLACLREHRRHVLWWDQYALNVVLAGHWRAWTIVGTRAHLFVYPTWRDSPLDRETFARLRLAPWNVHFCSPSKPWQYFCAHPFAEEFLACLDQTDWKGWRPARPDDFLKKWWDFHYQPLRARWKSQTRAIKRAIRGNHRRAA